MKERMSMFLQDRDYTKYLNEEEKKAFELEEKIQNRKGIKSGIFRVQYSWIIPLGIMMLLSGLAIFLQKAG